MSRPHRPKAKPRSGGLFHRGENSEPALYIALVSAIDQKSGGKRNEMQAERAEQQRRWAEEDKQRRKEESRLRHEQELKRLQQEQERLRPLHEFAAAVQEAGIPATMHFGAHPKTGKPAAILTFPDQATHTRFVSSELFRQGLAVAKRVDHTLMASLQKPAIS